jgi:hypothetical protein
VTVKVCLNETLFRRTDSILWNGSNLTIRLMSVNYSLPNVLRSQDSSIRGNCREGMEEGDNCFEY